MSAWYSAGASGFASAATVRAPARRNASTMSTRWPAQVKRTLVTRSVQQERQAHEHGGGQNAGDGKAEPAAQAVEGVAEGKRPRRNRREHVARLEDVAVRRGIADREVEVAEQAEAGEKDRGDPRGNAPRPADQHDPACDREQRR